MRLDNVIREERRSIESILRALTNNLLARDNFAPDGEAGQVLTSNGPGSVPSFKDLPTPPAASEEDGEIDASRIVGTLAEARLQGSYRGITSVDELAVTEHQAALSIGWSQLTSVPTTIAGYGITDAYTKTEVDALLAALSLDDLDDVVITSPAVKDVLRHNGTNWVNTQLAFSDLSGSIADAQVPESAVTQHEAALSIGWSQLTSVPTTLSGYGITDAYTKTEADTLLAAKADSATTLAGYGITDAYTKSAVDALLAALTIDDLSDVVITTPAATEVLAYDGSDWVNQALDASYIEPETFPTGAGKYIIDPSTGFETPLEITLSVTSLYGLTLRGYATGSGWVGAIQLIDQAGTRYGMFGKASSSDADIYLQSYQGGFRFWARNGDIQFAPGGTTTTWTMDASTFDLVASSVAMLRLAAGTTSKASLRIPHGSAPTSPVNGDMWTTTSGLFVRINGVTKTLPSAGSGGALDDLSDVVITTPTAKDVLAYDGTDWDNTAIDASYVNPGTFPDGDFTFGDQYIIKNVLDGTGQAIASLAKEEFHFSGHQTADNVQGLSWSWGSVPDSAQAKLIVQMSGAYGSKMYLMTTNSFATGAQTAMLIDHLGVVSINRTTGKLIPGTNGVQALGDSSHLWDAVYTEKLFGKSGLVCGSGTIVSGNTTATIGCTAVTTNSKIFIQSIDTVGEPARIFKITGKVVGTSFTVWRNDSAGDCNFHWFLIDSV